MRSTRARASAWRLSEKESSAWADKSGWSRSVAEVVAFGWSCGSSDRLSIGDLGLPPKSPQAAGVHPSLHPTADIVIISTLAVRGIAMQSLSVRIVVAPSPAPSSSLSCLDLIKGPVFRRTQIADRVHQIDDHGSHQGGAPAAENSERPKHDCRDVKVGHEPRSNAFYLATFLAAAFSIILRYFTGSLLKSFTQSLQQKRTSTSGLPGSW